MAAKYVPLEHYESSVEGGMYPGAETDPALEYNASKNKWHWGRPRSFVIISALLLLSVVVLAFQATLGGGFGKAKTPIPYSK